MNKINVEWCSYSDQRPKEDDDYLVVVHTDDFNYVCIGNWSSHDGKFKDPNLEAVHASEHALMKDALWNKWYNYGLDMFNRRVIAWAKIPKSYESNAWLN